MTFQIPDELYREVKAEAAQGGPSVRDVTIKLFPNNGYRRKNSPPLMLHRSIG